MGKILGLDIGTNSIGWALIENNQITALGSRIVPMGAERIAFEKGEAQTKNAKRRIARGIRKLNKRYKQRRNKLVYVLKELGMLPHQFQTSQEFDDPERIQKVSLLPIPPGTLQKDARALFELRTKALSERIGLVDLGRLLYLFNQLRGYAGGGGDNADDADEKEEGQGEEDQQRVKGQEKVVDIVRIASVSSALPVLPAALEDGKKQRPRYNIHVMRSNGEELEGETYLDKLKEGEEEELQIIIRRSRKNGEISSVFFSLPAKTAWRKGMEDFDKALEESGLHPGEFFYRELQKNRWYKVRKKVILRHRLQAEFDAIWEEQSKHHAILREPDKALLEKLAAFLFPGTNPAHNQANFRKDAVEGGLRHIIRNQIIYYQRELKDQSHLIGKCQFEKEERVIPKSHPLFQEFKIWEQVAKLTINTKREVEVKEKQKTVYDDKLTTAAFKASLYEELQDKREISFSAVHKKLGLREKVDFLNGLAPKGKLKGNETRQFLQKAIGKELFTQLGLNETRLLTELWEILYTGKGNEYDINSDRTQRVLSFLKRQVPDAAFDYNKKAVEISKIQFRRSYGSLSAKAIGKILPLMRAGKYYDAELLPAEARSRLSLFREDKAAGAFEIAVAEHVEKFPELLAEGGMMYAHTSTLVYGQHTVKEIRREDSLADPRLIEPLPPGELRNPIGEQMVNETMRVVADIWATHGKPEEIRVELARELKNSADERAKISSAQDKARKTNERIKDRLTELKMESSLANIERYKLWSGQEGERGKEIMSDASKSEIERMKLWENQGLVSPYTGRPIPLSELFDRGKWDIDHIIPKSRFFDDSLANKVICERAVNDDKGNRTAWEYFEMGSTTLSILSQDAFMEHVNKHFVGRKRKNLLAREIPKDFVERQKKDTQYISLRVKEELAKVVGTANVKTTTGGITDYLRTHWGLTDKYKDITRERYARLAWLHADEEAKKQKLSDEERDALRQQYESEWIARERGHWKIKGWSKRHDHRHHALDALVIACTEPAHVQRLNNLNKELQDWLRKNKHLVRQDFTGTDEELVQAFLELAKEKRDKILLEIQSFRKFDAPWPGFVEDAKRELEKIIVSIKPKQKLLVQKVQKGSDAGKKDMLRIRGPLHEQTIYGKSNGAEAYRISLTKLGAKKDAALTAIDKVIDRTLAGELKEHLLKRYNGEPKEAFSAEGIKEFNKSRPKPVYYVKVSYVAQTKNFPLASLAKKSVDPAAIFQKMVDADLRKSLEEHLNVTHRGNKASAFSAAGIDEFNAERKKPLKNVKILDDASEGEETESLQRLNRKDGYNNKLYVKTGGNYAFAILEKVGERHFDLISFFDAAKLAKEGLDAGNTDVERVIAKEFQERHPDSKLLYLLKQDDFVYLPAPNEKIPTDESDEGFEAFWNDGVARSKNVHSVVKFSGNEIYFLKHIIADVVEKKREFGSQDCYQTLEGRTIRNHCIKIVSDRLGRITPTPSIS